MHRLVPPPRARGTGASLVVLLLLAAAGPGCASRVSTERFAITAQRDANDQSPVPLDMVLVRDPALVDVLNGMTARVWFETRDQIARDNPTGFEVVTWEVVPGQHLDTAFPFRNNKGIALFVFANYLSPGAHRVRVDPLERFTLLLGKDGFSVESGA